MMNASLQENAPRKKSTAMKRAKRNTTLFYVSLMALPVAQFLFFYIGVNFRSLLYAFQKIDVVTNKTTWTIKNFTNIFHSFKTSNLYLDLFKTSILSYLITLIVGVPLGLFFSFYIAEKLPGASAFRVILFLPSIISSVTLVSIYSACVNQALPALMNDLFGKAMKGGLDNENTRYFTIMFYNVLISFGASVLMYSNSMSAIAPEIIEAGKLDGATGMKKFIYIVFPQVFGTLSTFLIMGVAGIFTSQIELFSFYEASAPSEVRTFGYHLYVHAQLATNEAEYPALAALGLLLTAIAVPLTMLVKWLLQKYGFSEE